VTVDIRRRNWCEYINDKYNNNCSDTLRDRVSCNSDCKSDGKAFIGVKVSSERHKRSCKRSHMMLVKTNQGGRLYAKHTGKNDQRTV
jgi:hypothetical protein